MPAPPKLWPFASTHFIPARARLAPCSFEITGAATKGRRRVVQLSYESVLSIGEEKFAAASWTKVEIEGDQPFNGTRDALLTWGRSAAGCEALVDETLSLQNLFVDHLKVAYSFNPHLATVRHFGPAEWPYTTVTLDGSTVLERANPALLSAVAARRITPSLPRLCGGERLPPALRGLLRACDLVECGYPTEAALTAFSILDAAVQETLTVGMQSLDVDPDSAEQLLRNTTQSRLATYLGPILKLITGHSLAEDHATLFGTAKSLNAQRNAAIHQGTDLTRSDGRRACLIVFDVLEYLNVVSSPTRELCPRPQFPDLNSDA